MIFNNNLSAVYFNEIGQKGFHGHLGLNVVSVIPEEIVLELPITAVLLAGNDYVHGGSLVTLADTACGYGCLAHLPEHAESFTTMELKTNFFGAIREGTLLCVAKGLHFGRTTQVWDAAISHKETNRLLALFRCTQLVLYPRIK